MCGGPGIYRSFTNQPNIAPPSCPALGSLPYGAMPRGHVTRGTRSTVAPGTSRASVMPRTPGDRGAHVAVPSVILLPHRASPAARTTEIPAAGGRGWPAPTTSSAYLLAPRKSGNARRSRTIWCRRETRRPLDRSASARRTHPDTLAFRPQSVKRSVDDIAA